MPTKFSRYTGSQILPRIILSGTDDNRPCNYEPDLTLTVRARLRYISMLIFLERQTVHFDKRSHVIHAHLPLCSTSMLITNRTSGLEQYYSTPVILAPPLLAFYKGSYKATMSAMSAILLPCRTIPCTLTWGYINAHQMTEIYTIGPSHCLRLLHHTPIEQCHLSIVI